MMETERIRIYPASREQMERIIAAEENGEIIGIILGGHDWRTRRSGDGTPCG